VVAVHKVEDVRSPSAADARILDPLDLRDPRKARRRWTALDTTTGSAGDSGEDPLQDEATSLRGAQPGPGDQDTEVRALVLRHCCDRSQPRLGRNLTRCYGFEGLRLIDREALVAGAPVTGKL
jgi:hypothetical protein